MNYGGSVELIPGRDDTHLYFDGPITDVVDDGDYLGITVRLDPALKAYIRITDEKGGLLEIKPVDEGGYKIREEGGLKVEETLEPDRTGWVLSDLSSVADVPIIRTVLGGAEVVADLSELMVYLETREGQVVEAGDEDTGKMVRIRPKLYKQE